MNTCVFSSRAAVGVIMAVFGVANPTVFAGPLQEAQVHKIVNDVRVIEPQRGTARPAKVRDVIKDDLAVRTGIQSRAELLFQDNTLTRLGAESLFSFKSGTREMTLDRGTMLLQVPKGLGGAKIRTAAVTAAITGTTIMIEHIPGKHVKVLVLEGSLRLSLDRRLGESVVLNPGKMIILSEKETRLPKPVSVDLAKVVKTSALIDPEQFRGSSKEKFDPLPSMPLIEKEIGIQRGAKEKLQLAETNLLIEGDGTNVIVASKETMAALDAATTEGSDSSVVLTMDQRSKPKKDSGNDAPQNGPKEKGRGKSSGPPAGGGNAGSGAGIPGDAVSDGPLDKPLETPPPNTNPDPTETPTTIPGTYTIKAGTVIDTTTTDPSITTDSVTESGLFFRNTTTSGSASRFLFGTTSTFDDQMDFDSHFNSQFSNTAVYKFTSLLIDGNPTFLTHHGANSVAWISETDINNSTTPGQVTLDGVKELFMGTVSGSINLTDKVAFAKTEGTAFSFLEFYARNGDVNFGAPVTLKDAKLYISAEGNVTISPTAIIWTKIASITGLGDVSMDGSIKADITQLYAGGALTVTGTVNGKYFYGFGDTGTIGGSIVVENATLELGSNVTLTPTADFAVKKLTLISGGNAVVAGAVTGEKLTFTVANAFTALAGSTLTALTHSGELSISSGGAIDLGGQVDGKKITLTAGTDPLQTGTIDIRGPVQATEKLTATGRTITITAPLTGKDFTFTGSAGVELASGASITSTGETRLISTTSVLLNGTGNFDDLKLGGQAVVEINGTTQAKKLETISGSAIKDIIINGPLTLDDDLKVNHEGEFLVAASATVTAGQKLEVTTTKGITFDGATSAKSFKLTATGDLTISAPVTTTDDFVATSRNATVSSDLSADEIEVSVSKLLNITSAATLTAATSITLDGDETVIAGRLDAPTVFLSGTTSLTMNATSGYVSADSVSLASDDGILTITAAFGGAGGFDAARLKTLQVSGLGVVVTDDFHLIGGVSTLSAGSGGIVATGTSLSGFDTVSVNAGNYTGRDLSTQTLEITGNGSLILTGDLTATAEATVSKNINLGGRLTADEVSAGTSITADSLSVGDLDTPTLTIGAGGVTRYAGGGSKINAPTIQSAFGIFMSGTAGTPTEAPGAGGSLELTTDVLDFDAASTAPATVTSANFDGGDADPSRSDAGGDGGVFNLNTDQAIKIDSPITADTGRNSTAGMTGGKGGTVELTSNGRITVNARVKVSSTETSADSGDNTPGRASRTGGRIKLVSKARTGTAIAVTSSGELYALLNAASPGQGGSIEFESSGGAISVVGGKIKADKGTVDIRNNGLAGTVTLTNATIRGDVVKVGALGANGQLLVGGGSINADSMLKLYGGSSGGLVRFTNDVTLGGAATKIIAGKTVTIDNGRTVNVTGSGPASVYTDTANYTGSGGNGSTSGSFGGAGATTQALIGAPSF